MRRALAVLATVTAAVTLSACGGGSDDSSSEGGPASTPIASPSSEKAREYTQEIVRAFRATHPAGGAHYDVPTSDWVAFVSTVEDLSPPDGEETDHEQMVAAFEAYVAARQDADDACAGGAGTSRACMTAVQKSGDLWTTSLDRAYELPGLSYGALIG